jgi:ABC-type Fe3+ transport system permease subunit
LLLWRRNETEADAVRIRADSVSISSVLLTIALRCLIPASWGNAWSGHNEVVLAQLDAGLRAAAATMSYVGFASLAIILIGLVVLWTGYVKRDRSAWFVMFIVVWLWAFPLFMFPFVSALVHRNIVLTFSETLYDAISGPGSPRSAVESVLTFSLMMIGLALPMRRFFGHREVEQPIHRPSSRVVGVSVIGALCIMIALYAWIRVGVLYEIPVTEISSSIQRLPSPPPPPGPNR